MIMSFRQQLLCWFLTSALVQIAVVLLIDYAASAMIDLARAKWFVGVLSSCSYQEGQSPIALHPISRATQI